MKDSRPTAVSVPDEVLARWQDLVDTMASLAGIPAGLIMRVSDENIEVLVASRTADNPYRPGSREHLADSGLYCETVLKTRRPLLVPDALSDPDWKENPDVRLGMISYLGFPVCFPDGTLFGTLCVLDRKANGYSREVHVLLEGFRGLIEAHLALLYMNAALGDQNRSLMDRLDEIRTLRGLVPICAMCKRIRDSRGYWNSVEQYLETHMAADLTHGYCPDCTRELMDELGGC